VDQHVSGETGGSEDAESRGRGGMFPGPGLAPKDKSGFFQKKTVRLDESVTSNDQGDRPEGRGTGTRTVLPSAG